MRRSVAVFVVVVLTLLAVAAAASAIGKLVGLDWKLPAGATPTVRYSGSIARSVHSLVGNRVCVGGNGVGCSSAAVGQV